MVKNKDKPEQKSTLAELVKDKELLKSFETNPDQVCSVIVQAKLPKRTFNFGDSASKRMVREKDSTAAKEERQNVLEQLMDQLGKVVGDENINLLKSAGSIVVTGTANQMEEISKLENIEAIWKNRELTVKKESSMKK